MHELIAQFSLSTYAVQSPPSLDMMPPIVKMALYILIREQSNRHKLFSQVILESVNLTIIAT